MVGLWGFFLPFIDISGFPAINMVLLIWSPKEGKHPHASWSRLRTFSRTQVRSGPGGLSAATCSRPRPTWGPPAGRRRRLPSQRSRFRPLQNPKCAPARGVGAPRRGREAGHRPGPSLPTQRPKDPRIWPHLSLPAPGHVPKRKAERPSEAAPSGPREWAPRRRLPRAAGLARAARARPFPTMPVRGAEGQHAPSPEGKPPPGLAQSQPTLRSSPFWAAAVAARSRSANARTWRGAMLRAPRWGERGGPGLAGDAPRDRASEARWPSGQREAWGACVRVEEPAARRSRGRAADASSSRDCALWASGGAEQTCPTWRPRLPAPAPGCSPLPAGARDESPPGGGGRLPSPSPARPLGATPSPGVRPAPPRLQVLPPAAAGGGGGQDGDRRQGALKVWTLRGFFFPDGARVWSLKGMGPGGKREGIGRGRLKLKRNTEKQENRPNHNQKDDLWALPGSWIVLLWN